MKELSVKYKYITKEYDRKLSIDFLRHRLAYPILK